MGIPMDEAMKNPAMAAALGKDVVQAQKRARVRAKSRVLHPYRSQLEADRAAHLNLLKAAGEIVDWGYEPATFHLPGGVKYKPDFRVTVALLMGDEGCIESSVRFEEVKGSKLQKNARDSITRLRVASGQERWARWVLVTRDRAGNWQEEVIR